MATNVSEYFYSRNPILDSEINVTFDEILAFTDDEFHDWCIQMRDELRRAWDEEDVPPVVGKEANELIEEFNNLLGYPVLNFLTYDDNTGEKNVIRNFTNYTTAANAFFPTMMKVRISSSFNRTQGNSIYDAFSDPDLEEMFYRKCKQKIRVDGMYSFSRCIMQDDQEMNLHTNDGKEWIRKFRTMAELADYDIWIDEKIDYPKSDEYVIMTAEDVQELYKEGSIEDRHVTNLTQPIDELTNTVIRTKKKVKKRKEYFIRVYEKGQKLFPSIFQVFRLGFNSQPAGNFPPLTAKLLYTYFTKEIDDDPITIYDPSSGWGGRLLGALTVDSRNIHYVGTDPNMDNYIEEIGKSRYELMADFYNENTPGKNNPFWGNPTTYEVFQDGSETIQYNPDFQKYKGKLDFIFTSPPYFNKERYSDDEAQSWKKYPGYDAWRDDFLGPTLKTAVEWLAPDRYLAWNIADVKVDASGNYLPLEADSQRFLEEYGMEYVTTFKMLMTTMIGIDLTKVKNTVKTGGKMMKYEPIFVYRKPKDWKKTW